MGDDVTKMAGMDVLNDSATDFCEYTGVIDPRIERLLWHLDDEPKKDVAAELSCDFSYEELNYVRERFFERSKAKASGKAYAISRYDLDKFPRQNVPVDGGDQSLADVPWSMIKRRNGLLIAYDVCDLYLYLTGVDKNFPTRILKRRVMAAKRKNVKEREIASGESSQEIQPLVRSNSVKRRMGEVQDLHANKDDESMLCEPQVLEQDKSKPDEAEPVGVDNNTSQTSTTHECSEPDNEITLEIMNEQNMSVSSMQEQVDNVESRISTVQGGSDSDSDITVEDMEGIPMCPSTVPGVPSFSDLTDILPAESEVVSVPYTSQCRVNGDKNLLVSTTTTSSCVQQEGTGTQITPLTEDAVGIQDGHKRSGILYPVTQADEEEQSGNMQVDDIFSRVRGAMNDMELPVPSGYVPSESTRDQSNREPVAENDDVSSIKPAAATNVLEVSSGFDTAVTMSVSDQGAGKDNFDDVTSQTISETCPPMRGSVDENPTEQRYFENDQRNCDPLEKECVGCSDTGNKDVRDVLIEEFPIEIGSDSLFSDISVIAPTQGVPTTISDKECPAIAMIGHSTDGMPLSTQNFDNILQERDVDDSVRGVLIQPRQVDSELCDTGTHVDITRARATFASDHRIVYNQNRASHVPTIEKHSTPRHVEEKIDLSMRQERSLQQTQEGPVNFYESYTMFSEPNHFFDESYQSNFGNSAALNGSCIRPLAVNESVIFGERGEAYLHTVNPLPMHHELREPQPIRMDVTQTAPREETKVRPSTCEPLKSAHVDVSVDRQNETVFNQPNQRDISQESVIKDILEVHNRVIVNSPAVPSSRSEPTKPSIIEMATQTEPNMIFDPPVKKSEYDRQIAYMERSLTDHERRMRASEMWNEKEERKVDALDAEFFNQNRVMRCEIQELRQIITDILMGHTKVPFPTQDEMARTMSQSNPDTTNQPHVTVPDFGLDPLGGPLAMQTARDSELTQGKTKQVAEMPVKNPPVRANAIRQVTVSEMSKAKNNQSTGKPGAVKQTPTPGSGQVCDTRAPSDSDHQASGAENNVRKKQSSVVDSIMRAARKVIPHTRARALAESEASNNRVDPNLLRVEKEELFEKSKPPPQHEAATRARPNTVGRASAQASNGVRVAMSLAKEYPPLPGPEGSMPKCGTNSQQRAVSWVEDDDEVSKTIEVLLADMANDEEEGSDAGSVTSADGAGNGSDFGGLRQNGPELFTLADVTEEQAPVDLSTYGLNRAPPAIWPNDERSRNGDRMNPGPSKQFMMQRGARPKEQKQGEFNVRRNANVGGAMGKKAAPSQSRVVTRNGWSPPDRKRKRTKTSPRAYPPRRATKNKPYRDIFVRGLESDGYIGPEDMEDAIQDYMDDRGVTVFFVRVISQPEPGLANVKVTVSDVDLQKTLDYNFWPEGASAREWYIKPNI